MDTTTETKIRGSFWRLMLLKKGGGGRVRGYGETSQSSLKDNRTPGLQLSCS